MYERCLLRLSPRRRTSCFCSCGFNRPNACWKGISKEKDAMKRVITTMTILLCASMAGAQLPPDLGKQAKTLAMLKAEIEGLRSTDVAWRKIAWKSCLLEGLKASREQKKPMILWVFIDRPVDD